jgi:HK97 family phage portal protein
LERGRERAPKHPNYRLLHDQPNQHMTSLVFREVIQVHTLTAGNGYAEIVRLREDGSGQPAALWPIPAAAVTPKIIGTDTLIYEVQTKQGIVRIEPENMLHVPGLGWDGIQGFSPIHMARQAIGMGLAADQFGASFFANGARPSGHAETPGTIKDIAKLRKDIGEVYAGSKNTGRIMLLQQGLKWVSTTIPPDEAQFLETRAFQVREIARIYRVPLHMVDETDKAASYASVEQFALMFVVHTLRPWLVRWEQELNRKLFPPDSEFYCEFLVDGLLRGDFKSRNEGYAIGKQWGFYSTNDILELENRNPVENGDDYWRPVNMVPVNTPVSVVQTKEPRSIQELLRIFGPLFADADWRWTARDADKRTAEAAKRIYLPVLRALVETIRGTEADAAVIVTLQQFAAANAPLGDRVAEIIRQFREVYDASATTN